MVNHFPNLVCWKEIFQIYDKNRDIVFLDGISSHFLGLLLGARGNYFSGPQMAHALAQDSFEDCYFFLPEDIQSIPQNRKIILPFRAHFDGYQPILNFLDSVPSTGLVVIGISSPKQNVFANYLYTIRPELDYFCLGAAVKQTWGLNANTWLRGSGLQWLEFMIFQPRRTIGKITRSIIEALSIIASPTRIRLFRQFVKSTNS